MAGILDAARRNGYEKEAGRNGALTPLAPVGHVPRRLHIGFCAPVG